MYTHIAVGTQIQVKDSKVYCACTTLGQHSLLTQQQRKEMYIYFFLFQTR